MGKTKSEGRKGRKDLKSNEVNFLNDHKPLVYIFGNKKGLPQLAASRLQR